MNIKRRIGSCFAATAIILGAACSRHDDTANDPRTLRQDEIASFLPLICAKEIKGQKDKNCAQLVGYPNQEADSTGFDVGLTSVAYGPFTGANADEAYVTYQGDFEPHANNFGGGILFERKNGQWKLVRWYPGGQMDNCVAVPGDKPQQMLCLSGWSGQGVSTSTVSISTLSGNAKTFTGASISGVSFSSPEIDANDDGSGYACGLEHVPNRSVLLGISDLKRSHGTDWFAEAKITFVRSNDLALCKMSNVKVPISKGVIHFKKTDDGVEIDAPDALIVAEFRKEETPPPQQETANISMPSCTDVAVSEQAIDAVNKEYDKRAVPRTDADTQVLKTLVDVSDRNDQFLALRRSIVANSKGTIALDDVKICSPEDVSGAFLVFLIRKSNAVGGFVSNFGIPGDIAAFGDPIE